MSLLAVLFSFDGRIGRQTFWLKGVLLGQLLLLVVFATAAGTDALLGADGFLTIVALLLALWVSLAVYTKRWHDRGKSGFWTLIMVVPFVGPLWMLIECGFLDGKMGRNQFGKLAD
jgi:uncharacterized membrane protein YhaH (DUF805 family)